VRNRSRVREAQCDKEEQGARGAKRPRTRAPRASISARERQARRASTGGERTGQVASQGARRALKTG
jgi:hypothetical protein